MEKDKVYAACPVCLLFVARENQESAKETSEKHNESAHNGEQIAIVVETNYASFAYFVENAKEKANEDQYNQLINKMEKGNLGIFLSPKEYREIMDRVE